MKEGLRLIKENGFYNFSMRDIAKNLGVSHGAPYKHFLTRDALLAAISEEGFNLLTNKTIETVQATKSKDISLLYNIAVMYIQFGVTYPEYYKLMFSGIIKEADAFPDLYNASTRSYNTFKMVIKELIDAKVLIPDADENRMTFYSWSLLHGVVSLILDNRMNIAFASMENPLDASLEDVFAYFLKGVAHYIR